MDPPTRSKVQSEGQRVKEALVATGVHGLGRVPQVDSLTPHACTSKTADLSFLEYAVTKICAMYCMYQT
eukprot:1914405-Prorocentrum_lima.AAC.1